MNSVCDYAEPGRLSRCPHCHSSSWNILTFCSTCEAPCCDSPECGSWDGRKGDELVCAKCMARLALEKQDEIAAANAEVLIPCAVEAICAARSVGQMSKLLQIHLAECAACAALIPVLKPIGSQVAQASIPEWNHKEVA